MAYMCKQGNRECDGCGSCKDKDLKNLPVCYECEEYIQQDSAVQLDGNWICDNCLEDLRVDILND